MQELFFEILFFFFSESILVFMHTEHYRRIQLFFTAFDENKFHKHLDILLSLLVNKKTDKHRFSNQKFLFFV